MVVLDFDERSSKFVVTVELVVVKLVDGNDSDCQNLLYGPTDPVILEDATELHEHVDANL